MQNAGKFESLTQDTIPSKLRSRYNNRIVVELEDGSQIYLKSFKSNKINEFIEFIQHHDLLDKNEPQIIHATGGGAYKYNDLFETSFGGQVKLQKHDEISSLVNGMSFVLNYAKDPSYTFREKEGKKMAKED